MLIYEFPRDEKAGDSSHLLDSIDSKKEGIV